MKLYAFDVDHTLEVSEGPIKIDLLKALGAEGHVVGIAGNWRRFVQNYPDWRRVVSFIGPCGGIKDDFLRHLKCDEIVVEEFVMVGNIINVSGASDDQGAAARAGWRFIRESDFAAGAR